MALKPSLRDVLGQLQSEGALPSDALDKALPALDTWWKQHGATPWFVRVLIGGGAWVASFFLLFCIGLLASLLGIANEKGAFIVMGLLTLAFAVGLRRSSGHDFAVQVSLAASLAGQAAFVGGLGATAESLVGGAVALLLIQVPLVLLSPDRIQHFLSTVAAAGSVLYLLFEAGKWPAVQVGLVVLAALAHAALLYQGKLRGAWERLASPLAFGLVCVFFATLLTDSAFAFRTHSLLSIYEDHTTLPPMIVTLGLASVTLFSAYRMLEENGLEVGGAAGVTVFAALGLTALLTLHTPGVIAAVGILALAFHRRSVVLLGLAVAFLLAFGTHYYYDLSLSLLAKSLALLGGGLVMFGVRLFVLRRFPAAALEAR